MSTKNKFILLLVIFLGLLLLMVIVTRTNESDVGDNEQVACTLEAKLCPDGSYVGRTGPQCEFAPCPGDTEIDNWNTYNDPGIDTTFRYPETIGTTYVSTVDWPPVPQILGEAYTCTEAGVLGERAGVTEQRVINGRIYCVTRVGEGAAGSTYIQYAYTSGVGADDTAILTFALRFPQCENYDEPQQSACKTEQESFDVDMLAHRMMSTLEVGE